MDGNQTMFRYGSSVTSFTALTVGETLQEYRYHTNYDTSSRIRSDATTFNSTLLKSVRQQQIKIIKTIKNTLGFISKAGSTIIIQEVKNHANMSQGSVLWKVFLNTSCRKTLYLPCHDIKRRTDDNNTAAYVFIWG